MNTLRANLGTATVLTLWLRDESGKINFADGDETILYLYPYGSSVKAEETGITGSLPAGVDGKALFTVTEAYAEANLSRGLYRFVVKVEGVQKADGLLEVV